MTNSSTTLVSWSTTIDSYRYCGWTVRETLSGFVVEDPDYPDHIVQFEDEDEAIRFIDAEVEKAEDEHFDYCREHKLRAYQML